jgi:transposase-like protein
VQALTALLADAARTVQHAGGDRWFVGETYVNVTGRWRNLCRGVDRSSAMARPAAWLVSHAGRRAALRVVWPVSTTTG